MDAKLALTATETIRSSRVEAIAITYMSEDQTVLAVDDATSGAMNLVDLPLRAIASRALALDARRLIIAHNHPSGSLEPSAKDFEATRSLVRLFSSLGVTIDDHLIVGGEECFSFHDAGLL
jgi:DNA repair protein RadC